MEVPVNSEGYMDWMPCLVHYRRHIWLRMGDSVEPWKRVGETNRASNFIGTNKSYGVDQCRSYAVNKNFSVESANKTTAPHANPQRTE
jgi:hypothetical protein